MKTRIKKHLKNAEYNTENVPEAIMTGIKHNTHPLSKFDQFKSKLKVAIQGVAITLFAGSPALADDIDIYTGQSVSGLGGDPALLVLLDSSGSMNWDMYSASSSTPTQLHRRRVFHLKDATRTLVAMAPGQVKMGFHNYSANSVYAGQVYEDYEAKPMSTIVATGTTPSNQTVRIDASLDDITQKDTNAPVTNSGNLTVGNEVTVTSGGGGGVGGGGGQTVNVTYQVEDDWDDGTTCNTEWVWPEDHLYSPRRGRDACGSGSYTAFRFTDIDIPADATITKAELVLKHSGGSNIAAGSARMFMENDFTADDYYWPRLYQRFDSSNVISTYVDFNFPAGKKNKNANEVIDISTVVAAAIKETRYATALASNDAVFSVLMRGTSVSRGPNQNKDNHYHRRYFAHDNDSSKAARLNIEYVTAGAPPPPPPAPIITTEVHKSGLHFRNLNIPQGSTITRARLYVKAGNSTHRNDAAFVVSRNTETQPADFSATNDLNTIATTWADATKATPANWNSGRWYNFDISGLVHNHINSGSWGCGKDLALKLEDDPALKYDTNGLDDLAQIRSFDSGDEPYLEISYSSASANAGCRRITSATRFRGEDVQEINGAVTTDGTNLSVATNHYVGLRFTNVEMTQNNASNTTKINNAFLTLTAGDRNDSDLNRLPSFEIRVTASPFVVFSNAAESVSKAPLISSTAVSWTPTEWKRGNRYNSPNVGPLIQSLVSSGDWEYGASIGFVISTINNSNALIHSWDHQNGFNGSQNNHYGRTAPELTIDLESDDARDFTTHREVLYDYVDSFGIGGGTPLIASYGQGMKYMLGDNIYDTALDYTAPIDFTKKCVSNHYIVVTDGDPSWDSNSDVTNLIDHFGVPKSGSDSDFKRAQRLASYMSNENGFGAHAKGGSLIKTHVIALGQGISNHTSLEQWAASGQGEYKAAKDTSDLITAFESFIGQIADNDSSIAVPGVSVNQANRFQHLDELYYAVFKPSQKQRWYGNVKRYQVDNDGNGKQKLIDVTGADAVDDQTKFFSVDSKSWWSHPIVDGSAVIQGGGAIHMADPAQRITLTNTAPYNNATPTIEQDLIPSATPNAHRIIASNASHNGGNITLAMTGVDALPITTLQKQQTQETVLSWGAGYDTETENVVGPTGARKRWGAALHASPLLVNYNSNGSQANNTIFVPTNEGFLHAIYTGENNSIADNTTNTGGREIFSWMPQDLLPNLTNGYKLQKGNIIYGLDSSWVSWRYDKDGDGSVLQASDHVYIYGGMRRGGRNYYSLDVSDAYWVDSNNDGINDNSVSPKLKWAIRGGLTSGFAKLGQTWARPVLRRVNLGGTLTPVAFLSGGYNPAHDVQSYNSPDTIGNAVYMVHAETGKLLWSTSNSGSTENNADMNRAVVAEIKTFDRNSDSIVDGFYALDIAGQLFRYEFDPDNKGAATLVSNVELVAELGITGPTGGAANNRRFYEAPSVAPTSGGDFVIAAVSGYRAQPLNSTTDEKLFFVIDEGAGVKPSVSNSVRNVNNLINVTDENNIPTAGDSNYADFTSKGWYIDLAGKAEKGMGAPNIFNGAIIFTTFEDNISGAGTVCSPVIGRSNLYALNFDSTGAVQPDKNQPASKKITGVTPGIAGGTQTIFVTDDNGDTVPAIVVGTQVFTAKDFCDSGAASCVLLPEGLGDVSHLRWYQKEW